MISSSATGKTSCLKTLGEHGFPFLSNASANDQQEVSRPKKEEKYLQFTMELPPFLAPGA
jgi:hypothetical protein